VVGAHAASSIEFALVDTRFRRGCPDFVGAAVIDLPIVTSIGLAAASVGAPIHAIAERLRELLGERGRTAITATRTKRQIRQTAIDGVSHPQSGIAAARTTKRRLLTIKNPKPHPWASTASWDRLGNHHHIDRGDEPTTS
jgi:hypothetical protein